MSNGGRQSSLGNEVAAEGCVPELSVRERANDEWLADGWKARAARRRNEVAPEGAFPNPQFWNEDRNGGNIQHLPRSGPDWR